MAKKKKPTIEPLPPEIKPEPEIEPEPCAVYHGGHRSFERARRLLHGLQSAHGDS